MPSTFECVGLQVTDDASLQSLLDAVLPDAAQVVASAAGALWRWQDPSGARLALTEADGRLVRITPSFAGEPGARLADVWPLNDDLAAADVVDEQGETLTRMAVELEQRVLLRPTVSVAGAASVVALGVDVTVHDSVEALDRSGASLLSEDAEQPLRMAPESFISYGLFGDPATARPAARLSGRVLRVDAKRNAMSGAAFVVARVRTTGMDVDVCIAGGATAALTVGGLIAGTVVITGSMPGLESDGVHGAER